MHKSWNFTYSKEKVIKFSIIHGVAVFHPAPPHAHNLILCQRDGMDCGTNIGMIALFGRYLIASHTTDYQHPMLFLNTLAVTVLVVAKLPNMHKVRIFGINAGS